MSGPVSALLSGNRLHLQHGPIDLIIGVEGDTKAAFTAAQLRFQTILERLVDELPNLRSADDDVVHGPVAQRMVLAVEPHKLGGFVTPMAAVAGAVAEEVLEAMIQSAPLTRAYVNNGGDIAFHLQGNAQFSMEISGLNGAELGRVLVRSSDTARGLASSGLGGCSLSMGITDSVTVLAASAAKADVAATLIANAVDLPGHVAIRRVPASELDPDSDLGARLVVTSVGALCAQDVALALDRGRLRAEAMRQRGLIDAAALFLRGQSVTVGGSKMLQMKGMAHA